MPDIPTTRENRFPILLPVVALLAALLSTRLAQPPIIFPDWVSAGIGRAVGWILVAYLGYRLARWRSFERCALVAWLLLGVAVLGEVLAVLK